MLGGVLKLAFSFSALFLFITLIWQASIADALPVRSILILIYHTCRTQANCSKFLENTFLKKKYFSRILSSFFLGEKKFDLAILRLEKHMNNIPSSCTLLLPEQINESH
jgi:hypothetical protein